VNADPDQAGQDEQSEAKPAASSATKKPNIVRRLYNWVLSWAETPYGVPALFVLAFAESSFFPIPPDVLLIALGLAAPTKAFRFAFWCALGSVLGGLLGYYIGYAVWSSVEPMIIPRLFSAEKFTHATDLYKEYGVAIVFAAGFSPIPYKVFTVAGGVARINLFAFVGASIVGRSARFFLVAWVVKRFGDQARDFIDRYFNLVTIGFTLFLVGGFLLIKLVL